MFFLFLFRQTEAETTDLEAIAKSDDVPYSKMGNITNEFDHS